MKLNSNITRDSRLDFPVKSRVKNTKSKDFSFSLIFKSNLKWAFRYSSSLILGLIFLVTHTFLTLLLTAFVPSAKGIEQSLIWQGVIKSIDYVVSCFFFFLFILFQTTYLFVLQRREGIHNIELRAGISPTQTFFLRIIVEVIVIYVYITISIIVVSLISLMSLKYGDYGLVATIIILPTASLYVTGILFLAITLGFALVISLEIELLINVLLLLGMILGMTISSSLTSLETSEKIHLKNQERRRASNYISQMMFANDFYNTISSIDQLNLANDEKTDFLVNYINDTSEKITYAAAPTIADDGLATDYDGFFYSLKNCRKTNLDRNYECTMNSDNWASDFSTGVLYYQTGDNINQNFSFAGINSDLGVILKDYMHIFASIGATFNADLIEDNSSSLTFKTIDPWYTFNTLGNKAFDWIQLRDLRNLITASSIKTSTDSEILVKLLEKLAQLYVKYQIYTLSAGPQDHIDLIINRPNPTSSQSFDNTSLVTTNFSLKKDSSSLVISDDAWVQNSNLFKTYTKYSIINPLLNILVMGYRDLKYMDFVAPLNIDGNVVDILTTSWSFYKNFYKRIAKNFQLSNEFGIIYHLGMLWNGYYNKNPLLEGTVINADGWLFQEPSVVLKFSDDQINSMAKIQTPAVASQATSNFIVKNGIIITKNYSYAGLVISYLIFSLTIIGLELLIYRKVIKV